MKPFFELCESPIEEMMAVALVNAHWPLADVGALPGPREWKRAMGSAIEALVNTSFYGVADDVARINAKLASWGDDLRIVPQAQLGRYRVDFLVSVRFKVYDEEFEHLIIECDGAEFHGPKDWHHDKRRQAEILNKHGLRMARFRGDEIYRDANACAAEVIMHMRNAHTARGLNALDRKRA